MILLLAVAFCGSIFAQKTVTFKPDSVTGKDATLHTHLGCVSTGQTKTRENRNFGNDKHFMAIDWTYNAIGCSRGTTRGLLKFNELSTIPQGAVIVSAELKLFGLPNSGDVPAGNSRYPGSPYDNQGSNQSHILRVTSDWDDQTVTWNTQPTTSTENKISIPQTTSQWNWNFTDNSDNLVAMIQDMVSNPEKNFGFMLKLDTESYYRSVIFASSNHDNAALHPELTVTYEYKEPVCACEANFAYMVTTGEPNNYSFMAANPAVSHEWSINGANVSNLSSFSHILSEGSNTICYTRYLDGKKCEKCITICVAEEKKDGPKTDPKDDPGEITGGGDIISSDSTASKLSVFPNPATTEWNVEFVSNIAGKVTVTLYDMNARAIYNKEFAIEAGKNSLKIDAKDLLTGSYTIKVAGAGMELSGVLIKN